MISTILLLAAVLTGGGVDAARPTAAAPHDAAMGPATEAPTRTVRMWVYLADKGLATPAEHALALDEARDRLSPRTLARRSQRGTRDALVDETDIAVAERYRAAIVATGATVRHTSRWLNAVSVQASAAQVQAIAHLPFVERLEPVRRSVPLDAEGTGVGGGPPSGQCPWGMTTGQLAQAGITGLHDAGVTGEGIVIGVLDTGFATTHEVFNQPGHEIDVIAAWDFVNDDPIVGYEPGDEFEGPFGTVYPHSHGTRVLSTIAGSLDCVFVGGAPDAAFVLAKTEDVSQEVPAEEDAYVAGLEFIEANGADLATSSLGYIDWYEWSDLNGQTAATTVAVNMATANGLVCVTAVGNGSHDSDLPTLIAPSDAFQVIAAGAVDPDGVIAGFSSNGPTADGRLKPEVLAQGVGVWCASALEDDTYSQSNGTSFSTPLTACAVALILQMHPEWSVSNVRDALFSTASLSVAEGGPDPDSLQGFGIIDALAASGFQPGVVGDLDGDGAVGGADLGMLLAAWGNCPGCAADIDTDGLVGGADLGLLLAAWTGG
ncbi:MAG: S8 family serine peptidase [Phycisphaerales bacterium]|nr:S8 family serine peptidase [Phycisphaerales bacterium]